MTGRRERGWVAAALAVVLCPCHLPLLAAAASGTVLGAFVSRNAAWLTVAGAVAFGITATLAWRWLSRPGQPDGPACRECDSGSDEPILNEGNRR